MALLFGTTWLVNALAISGVLAKVLVVNLIVLRGPRIDKRRASVQRSHAHDPHPLPGVR